MKTISIIRKSGFPMWAALWVMVSLLTGAVTAQGLDRRRDQFGKEFSYYLYPIPAEIPGIGKAFGWGASILNMGGTDADFTAFKLTGDFSASGYTLLDLHLIPRHLIVDFGVYDYNVYAQTFDRGRDSSTGDYIFANVDGRYRGGQLTLSAAERMFELYGRLFQGTTHVDKLLDKDLKEFKNQDQQDYQVKLVTYGAIWDYTDDRLDPRKGFRVEAQQKYPSLDQPLLSRYYINDANITGYIPVGDISLVALNYFQSDAVVTSKGETDYGVLQARAGFGCAALPPSAQPPCLAAEAKRLNEIIAGNTYGNATPLGGTQRLRSYPNGRWRAGHAVFYGGEFRWNLTDEYTPFDWLVAKGVRTGLQVAFFAEQGNVADHPGDLWGHMKESYGTGFRLVLSGVIIRADWATGNEGSQFQLFIDYPWRLYSVDNST
ncbi:MAG: hypothetical protein OEW12_05025 [Deltaproteobacteria bacterium]|nr:hypothetical protein [Deltaproteobacteria bacterium]